MFSHRKKASVCMSYDEGLELGYTGCRVVSAGAVVKEERWDIVSLEWRQCFYLLTTNFRSPAQEFTAFLFGRSEV